MRIRNELVKELSNFTLKNIKRLEVKFDPFHPNAANLRQFYGVATDKKSLKTNPECITKAQIVCDQSDPLVTIHFQNNHKLTLNSKYLQSVHIVKLVKRFNEIQDASI